MVLVETGSLQSLPVQVGVDNHRTVRAMSHIVDSCMQTEFECELTILHDAEEDAVNWLNSVVTTALEK